MLRLSVGVRGPSPPSLPSALSSFPSPEALVLSRLGRAPGLLGAEQAGYVSSRT